MICGGTWVSLLLLVKHLDRLVVWLAEWDGGAWRLRLVRCLLLLLLKVHLVDGGALAGEMVGAHGWQWLLVGVRVMLVAAWIIRIDACRGRRLLLRHLLLLKGLLLG